MALSSKLQAQFSSCPLVTSRQPPTPSCSHCFHNQAGGSASLGNHLALPCTCCPVNQDFPSPQGMWESLWLSYEAGPAAVWPTDHLVPKCLSELKWKCLSHSRPLPATSCLPEPVQQPWESILPRMPPTLCRLPGLCRSAAHMQGSAESGALGAHALLGVYTCSLPSLFQRL